MDRKPDTTKLKELVDELFRKKYNSNIYELLDVDGLRSVVPVCRQLFPKFSDCFIADKIKELFDFDNLVVKTGQWSNEEVTLLEENTEKYLIENDLSLQDVFKLSQTEKRFFYRYISVGIQRFHSKVARKFAHHFITGNHVGRYTPSEARTVVNLEKQYRYKEDKWKAIGTFLGRSPESIRKKSSYERTAKTKGKSRWSKREVKRLLEGLEEYKSDETGPIWERIAEIVKTKNKQQCYSKYRSMNRPSKKFCKTDSVRLVEHLHSMNIKYCHNVNWQQIASTFNQDTEAGLLKSHFKYLCQRFVPLATGLMLRDVTTILMDTYVQKYRTRLKNLEVKAELNDVDITVKLEQHTTF